MKALKEIVCASIPRVSGGAEFARIVGLVEFNIFNMLRAYASYSDLILSLGFKLQNCSKYWFSRWLRGHAARLLSQIEGAVVHIVSSLHNVSKIYRQNSTSNGNYMGRWTRNIKMKHAGHG